jgi:hypothetical protein
MNDFVERSGQFLRGVPSGRKTGNELLDRRGGIHTHYRTLVNILGADETAIRDVLHKVVIYAEGVSKEPASIWLAEQEYAVEEKSLGVRGTGLPRNAGRYVAEAIAERREAYAFPVLVQFPKPAHQIDGYGNQLIQGRVVVMSHNRLHRNDLAQRLQKLEEAFRRHI